MILIGISGKKQAGKNTVATILAQKLGKQCVEYAFADALKLEVAQACKVSVAVIEMHKETYRPLLQAWGSLRRAKNVDYFTEIVVRKILAQKPEVAILTDVRYLNEAECVRKAGGYLIRVARSTAVDDTHESETSLDHFTEWDGLILNTGSMVHLKVEVDDTIKKLKL